MISDILLTVFVGKCGNQIGNAFWSRILGEHWLDYNGTFIPEISKHMFDWTSNDYQQIEQRLSKISSYFQEIDSDIINGFIRQCIENKYQKLTIPNDIQYILKSFYGEKQKYVPRAILIDDKQTVLNEIKTSNIGNLFTPNNYIYADFPSSQSHCWACGHYTTGAEIIDDIMNVIRYNIEKCDNLQGFQLNHSIGGGIGGGLGTLILRELNFNYPNKIVSMFTVYPSTKVSNVVIEPYNAILSLDKMLSFRHSSFNFVLDNEALYNISHNNLKQFEPKYSDLNWLISMVMSGITSTFRLNGDTDLHSDLRRFAYNMIPFPRLKFMLLSHAPIYLSSQQGMNSKACVWELAHQVGMVGYDTLSETVDQMESSRNFYANIKSEDGKCIVSAHVFRGKNVIQQAVDDELAKIPCKMADDFVTWIPNNRKSTIIRVPVTDVKECGTYVCNTTAIKGVFQRISAQFAKLYKRKAFLYKYKDEGMDEMEFQESDENVRDLINEYQDKQDAVVDLCDSDDDYDESDDEEESDCEEEEYSDDEVDDEEDF